MFRAIMRLLYPFAVMGYLFMCLLMGLFIFAVCFGMILPGLQGLVNYPADRAIYVFVLFWGFGCIAMTMQFLRDTHPGRYSEI